MKPLLACLDVFFTTQTELSKSKILLAQNFILKTVARLYLRSKAILVADPLVEMAPTKSTIRSPRHVADGEDRSRTGNLRLAKPALSQLSYIPIVDFVGATPPTKRSGCSPN